MKLRRLTTFALVLPLPALAALALLRQQAFEAWPDRRAAHGSAFESAATGELNAEAFARGQAVASLTLHPATLVGGQPSRVTVTLRYPAREGGSVVRITTADPKRARAPESVRVPAGERAAAFTVETVAVEKFTAVGLSVSHEGRTESDALTLMPPPRREWYAAPAGGATAKGTKDSPWDLKTALAGGTGGAIKPGDTIWLRGGRYEGAFTSTVAGTQDAPVVVRALPGERVVFDRAGVGESKQPALKVKGPWVWFWGFEITNSHPDRGRTNPYTRTVEPWRPSGADVYAESVKFINMVFHDNGHGIWDKKSMTEVYGSIFYYNGNNKREHAMYVGNAHGTKFVVDNVVFDQAGYGILCHSDSPSSSQKGLHIEGNASFNNGIITRDDQVTGNIQVSGVEGVPAERVVLKSNYVYNPPGNAASKNNGIRLGYEDTGNKDAKLLDNYIVSDAPLRVWWWQSVESQGNTIYSQKDSAELRTAPGVGTSAYRWDSNTYLGGRNGKPSFTIDGRTYSFSSWRQATGFDDQSRVVQNASPRPSGVVTFVRPNKYESGRAHIIIYNWDHRPRVTVEIGSLLAAGASYEVLDAQNLFGGPVACGTYDGAPIELPMNLTRVADPVGGVERTPSHTAPEFAVFVLRQDPRRQCR